MFQAICSEGNAVERVVEVVVVDVFDEGGVVMVVVVVVVEELSAGESVV